MNELDLDTRTGLPDALRVLLQAFPRDSWQGHEHFGEMVQFWLQRHLMFREVLARLQSETREFLDGETEDQRFKSRLSRLGGFFLQELHAHHTIEDTHYFPQLVGLEPRLQGGFDLLDADHHAIDANLQGFAGAANALLRVETPAQRDAAAAVLTRLDGFHILLNRHLTDEEELIVPIILNSGFSQ